MITVTLGTQDGHSLPLVGGKAARLSMLADDFPVPGGFVVTTEGFGIWQREGAATLPRIVEAEIDRALGKVSFPVAVRSSGADEDGSTASFAGMHETFLNLRQTAAVQTAVLACWRSTGLETAAGYRREKNLDPGGEMAVLIQEMIEAETAGVAFTANPVTSNRDEILINASWGLGPSIVDGTVTPDTFLIGKKGLDIIRKEISDKEVMTKPCEGGTQEVSVPKEMRLTPSLTDEQSLEVARMGIKLEKIFGWPADFEWAIAGSRLWLLQCRPITTL